MDKRDTYSLNCDSGQERIQEFMNTMIMCILVSVCVSVIANKILAVYSFKVIDGYVKDLFEITIKSIRDAYSGERTSEGG